MFNSDFSPILFSLADSFVYQKHIVAGPIVLVQYIDLSDILIFYSCSILSQ
jgi:hypothetical protein